MYDQLITEYLLHLFNNGTLSWFTSACNWESEHLLIRFIISSVFNCPKRDSFQIKCIPIPGPSFKHSFPPPHPTSSRPSHFNLTSRNKVLMSRTSSLCGLVKQSQLWSNIPGNFLNNSILNAIWKCRRFCAPRRHSAPPAQIKYSSFSVRFRRKLRKSFSILIW